MNQGPPLAGEVPGKWAIGQPHGSPGNQAQEKPERDEQPERAPEGMEGPAPIRKLAAEMVFLTSRLWQAGHLMISADDEEVVSTSKCFLQSLQTYS